MRPLPPRPSRCWSWGVCRWSGDDRQRQRRRGWRQRLPGARRRRGPSVKTRGQISPRLPAGRRRVEFGKMEISLLSPPAPSLASPACLLPPHTNNQTFVCVSPPPLSSLRIDPSAAAARTGSDSSAALSKHFCRGSMIYCGFLRYPAAACCITKPLYER